MTAKIFIFDSIRAISEQPNLEKSDQGLHCLTFCNFWHIGNLIMK